MCLGPCQGYLMELFAKIFEGQKLLIIFPKGSIRDNLKSLDRKGLPVTKTLDFCIIFQLWQNCSYRFVLVTDIAELSGMTDLKLYKK